VALLDNEPGLRVNLSFPFSRGGWAS
jgi:hypothetical protein